MSEYEEAERAALRTGATLLATTAGAALAGPGAGIFAGMASDSLMGWFDAYRRGNDDALRSAAFSALQDEVRKLSERLALLEKRVTLDHDDPLSRQQVFSEFAKDVTQAASPAKREALVNAAANRFDSTKGSDGLRAYWYRAVAALSDAELELLRLLTKYKALTIAIEPNHHVRADRLQGGSEGLSLSESDAVALYTVAVERSGNNGVDALFHRATVAGNPGQTITLAARGRAIASFIAD